MAWDLWSSSCDQVLYDGNYSERSEWQRDYFGCGRDAIEEDALNEESCVQVLRILITKADTEIEELEKDLLSLQNELAWAEHENWPEICCSALTERINRLDVAVSALKSDRADDLEMQLPLLHSKPAETLHEIVKALQRDHCQDTHGQHLDANILNPIVNVTEQALDKDSKNIDSNGSMREEGKEHNGTSENSVSPELLLELHEKRSDDPEKIEELLAISLVTSPDLGAISCLPDDSDGMTLSETLDDKVTGEEDVRQSQLIPTDTGQILNSFLSKGNGNIPSEAEEEDTIVKENFSSDDFRLATDIKGRKKYLHSKIGTAQQKSGNSDLDKKLHDFAPKTARRACRKESKLAPNEDLESMNMPLQVVYPQKLCFADTELSSFKGTNGNNSLQVINIDNAALIHAENSALISLLGMQTKSALYTGLQLTDEEKPLAQDLKSEIAANLSKSNMSFPSKRKALGKQKPEVEACSAREPLDSPTEVIPSTSEIVSTKRQRKSKTRTASAIVNESMNWKITERAADETEGGAIVLYDSKFSELQKKRRVSKSPITTDIQNSTVNLDITNSDRVPMDNGSQVDVYNSKSYSLVDSHNENSALLPNTLKSLTLINLRAMAKQHNIKKYYKLPKAALVEQLVERLSSC